jgi:predicted SAM-dependent methyltransferase
MVIDGQFEGWDWNDPAAVEAGFEPLIEYINTFDTVELVAPAPPRDRAGLRAAGISGIEFAAFKTQHAEALGSDLASLHARKADTRAITDAGGQGGADGLFSTRLGPLYRIDGQRLFTQLDICEPLPFDDGCVDWVYAEHLIEHVPLPAAVGWLREVRRILAAGGLLRLSTPDLALYMHGYETGGFFAKHRGRLARLRVGPPMPERRAFMVNQIFYHFGHRWIYDADELRHVLGEAGFALERVTVCEFRQGLRADVADLDTSMRRDETIYVEAVA